MRTTSLTVSAPLAPICFLVVTGCVQPAMTGRTAGGVAGDILSSIVLAGSATTPSSGGRAAPAATRVIGTAEQYLGVPYKWGGSSPSTGFDCSGYVKYVYARQGVALPRTSREQARAGAHVAPRVTSLRQGDLMLFAEGRSPISHVADLCGGRTDHPLLVERRRRALRRSGYDTRALVRGPHGGSEAARGGWPQPRAVVAEPDDPEPAVRSPGRGTKAPLSQLAGRCAGERTRTMDEFHHDARRA